MKKGEDSLSSSRLEKFSYSPETHHILAKVRASMKDKSYSVEVSNHTYTDVTLLDFENSLSSSRLEKFSYSPETHHILAKVRASMKDKSYSVEVSNHTYTDVTLLDFCFLPFYACSVAFQVEVMIS